MKAIANGALHLSTLDGWWDEAFRPGLGWAIGDRRDYADPAEQDAVDRESLFYLLEREVVPLFYERQDGIPQGWLAMMRASMTELTARFSTERMLGEYDEQYYQPATALAPRLTDGAARSVRRLSTWLQRVESAWPGVRIERLEADSTSLSVGAPLRVEAQVELGGLEPADVAAHLLIGPLDESGELLSPREVPLHPRRSQQNGRARFRSDPLQLETSGTLGLLVRVMPRHSDLLLSQALGRARWGP
jgi:starch phosphorylase